MRQVRQPCKPVTGIGKWLLLACNQCVLAEARITLRAVTEAWQVVMLFQFVEYFCRDELLLIWQDFACAAQVCLSFLV